jgi:hypothetical protein
MLPEIRCGPIVVLDSTFTSDHVTGVITSGTASPTLPLDHR